MQRAFYTQNGWQSAALPPQHGHVIYLLSCSLPGCGHHGAGLTLIWTLFSAQTCKFKCAEKFVSVIKGVGGRRRVHTAAAATHQLCSTKGLIYDRKHFIDALWLEVALAGWFPISSSHPVIYLIIYSVGVSLAGSSAVIGVQPEKRFKGGLIGTRLKSQNYQGLNVQDYTL